MRLHLFSVRILYLLTILILGYALWTGEPYYRLPRTDRPHYPLHTEWKPGGIVGHGLGVIGSFLMVVLLLYSVRKRFRFMQRWGNIRYWLNYHIWMGVTGPLLVILHSAFKFGGIIAVSFWSMVAVAVSGVLGRYLYLQIPRSVNGVELTPSELAEQQRRLMQRMRDEYGLDLERIGAIEKVLGTGDAGKSQGLTSVGRWVLSDLALPLRVSKLRNVLSGSTDLTGSQLREAIRNARNLALLRRRMAFLKTAQALLHHWHIVHRPFAAVMLIIMMIHVGVTIFFGYTWIF